LASKFQQTTNKTLPKIVSKKFNISIKKMQTFMPSSSMKNEQQSTFHKKVRSKRRGKNQAFYAFTHTRLFSMVYNFFLVDFFCNFLKSLALGLKFRMIRYSILIFQLHFF